PRLRRVLCKSSALPTRSPRSSPPSRNRDRILRTEQIYCIAGGPAAQCLRTAWKDQVTQAFHVPPSEITVAPAASEPTDRPSWPTSPKVVVALLCPFTKDGSLDGGALAAHVDFLVESGVDALMPGGTTGEGPLLDDAELLDVAGRTLAAASGRVR